MWVFSMKQDSYSMHLSNDDAFSNTLCTEDGFTTSTPKQCGGFFVPTNTMNTSLISCVKISGLTHHTVLAFKSVPLEPEAFSTGKKTRRCLKTLAGMRDFLKRTNAQHSCTHERYHSVTWLAWGWRRGGLINHKPTE